MLQDFFKYLMIDSDFISLNVAKLFLYFILILVGFWATRKLRVLVHSTLLSEIKNKKLVKFLSVLVVVIFWVLIFNIVLLTSVKSPYKQIIYKNDYLFISLTRLIVSGIIIIVAVFFHKFVNIRFFSEKKDKDKKYLLRIFVNGLTWIFASYFILRLLCSGFNNFTTSTLFSIKDVSISISDFLYTFIIGIAVSIILLPIKKFFKVQVQKKHIESGTAEALFKITKYLIVILTILIILQNVGFQLSILLAGSAALLVGLGMGMQQIFSDIASGFLLLAERTLKIDDVIEVDGIVGKVVKSSLRTTTVLTRDNIRIIVPNTRFTAENVINWSHIEKNTRFHINVGVAYGSDVQLVIGILETCANSHPEISKENNPFVRFNNFGDSSLDFQLFFWSNSVFKVEDIKSDLRIIIDKEFRDNNVQIPFPQTDVHIIKS